MQLRTTRFRQAPRAALRCVGLLLVAAATSFSLVSCELSQAHRAEISVSITAAGSTRETSVPGATAVTPALQAAGITPGELDKSEPPFYTVLSSGDAVKLVRVRETFETETQTIPFDRQ